MADFKTIKDLINEEIVTNGQGLIDAVLLRGILIGMLDAVGVNLDNKVDTETGKGLSANDFTNALKSKLNNMPYITAYDYTNHLVTLSDGTHSQVYQLTPYVPIPDYYVGFANSSTANFQAMTKEQLMELAGQGKTVDSNPSYSGTWDEYILFVLKRTNVSIASATFTSIAGGGAQQLELATMHDNITVDGTTYNVVGKRLGVFNAGQDTFIINFSKQ